MKKKILIICIAAILLASIAVVSAAADTHESDGVKYNAPDGYKFDQKAQVINTNHETYVKEGACYIYAKGSDEVRVTVFDLVNPSSTNDDIKKDLTPGYTEKTIAGIDGFFYDNGATVTFDFIKDGKYIYITAPNEQIIEDMLK